jgi:eukaryotic-like serine/threonine-protein kinase
MQSETPTVESIVSHTLTIADTEERAAYLDKACGPNKELRQRVEKILESHVSTGKASEPTQEHLAATQDYVPNPVTVPIQEGPGTRIGPYQLVRIIGQGGMGAVYLAEQVQPVRRKVALKIIKPGMDTQQVIARFEAERQALALMDHPSIARVFDAGSTDSGRPYFVMELVDGIPITSYCDRNKLQLRQRLELFIGVCHAVQHAHQKGIIHRDLKPSNVLVATQDGVPAPKVIDFGIAKATNQQLTDRTLTRFDQLVGTPLYMSPEQAELSGQDVDTRTDIYSLGVVLYELLAGATPVEAERLRASGFDEMRRIIREEEPPKPSTRVSSLGPRLDTVSTDRGTEPSKLRRLLRGELDWIVMKALEKDRTRRYETANHFAADVERYLNNEAVEACPPSAAYRFRKFARRNRLVLTAATLISASLVLGTAVSIWQAILARRAGARAEQEAQTAKTESAIAQAVNDFLLRDLLSQASPESTPDRDLKLRTVLERASKRIEGRFQDQPLVEAAIRTTLGHTHFELGDYPPAELHHRRAAELYGQTLGPDDPRTLTAMSNMANVLNKEGRLTEARTLQEEVLETRKRVLGSEDPATISSLGNLAHVLRFQGRLKEARELYEQELEYQRRTLGAENPHTLLTMNNLAGVYRALGLRAEWGKLHEEVLRVRRRALPPENPDLLMAMDNMAIVLSDQGRLDEARKLHEEVLAIRKRVLGPEHPETLATMDNLGSVLKELGMDPFRAQVVRNPNLLEESRKLHEETLRLRRRVLGPTHPDTLRSMNNLAGTLLSQSRYTEAQKLFEEVVEIKERTLGRDHPDTLLTINNLATMLMNFGHLEEARKLLEEAIDRNRERLGPNHPETLKSMGSLAWTLVVSADPKLRDPARGIELAKEVTEKAPKDGNNWNTLGVAYYRAGDWKKALVTLEKSAELRAGGDSFDWFFLAMTHWQLGHKDEPRKWYDKAVAWMEKNRPQDKEFLQFRDEAAKLLQISRGP